MVQQDGAMLHRDVGDPAIYRAVDGDFLVPLFNIYSGSRLPGVIAGIKVILRR